MKRVTAVIAGLFAFSCVAASKYATPQVDPWLGRPNDSTIAPPVTIPSGGGRSQVINPAQKTLVLIIAGQSQWINVSPSLYIPVNNSVVDAFSIYDGGSYAIAGALAGTQIGGGVGQGIGHVGARVADLFVTNGNFDKVIVAPVALGGTTVAQWATSTFYDRVCLAVSRLAGRGITPSTTGVTFAFLWGQGEMDNANGTTQIAYTNSFNSMFTSLQACGVTGFRTFVIEETWASGTVSSAVENAQIALVNNTTLFSGGNLDTLNASNRNSDNTHFNNTGAANAATIVYNAMHSSGSPF